jgi:hypothetical protein
MCYGSSMTNTDKIFTYTIHVEYRHESQSAPTPLSTIPRHRTMTVHEEFTVPAENLEVEMKAVMADLIGHELLSQTVTGHGEPF